MKRNRPTLKQTPHSDWRHALFRKVLSPTKSQSSSLKEHSCGKVSDPCDSEKHIQSSIVRKTREDIRELWKNAIRQQILLNRMDKQNHFLKAKQDEATGKRVKLSYDTLGICDEEASDTWDAIIKNYQSNGSGLTCDLQLLDSAILRGIPKYKRGNVWQFFIQQRRKTHNNTRFKPKIDVPYENLLKQLTSHQHAILIDLGRTFPSHPFFCDPLGTGQLALFNLLKAYSILDPDVGYCQGLSFVAGILLMHFEEEEAFSALKYIMFDLGAREHYKPEMSGLQVKLYQLTRMMHDQDPELHVLLDKQDILPTLYAAPWFLTMFAAQFSVGFAVRVIDVVLLHGIDLLTKFAIEIILDHSSNLKKCLGLEQVMECFRQNVTQIGSDDVNRYLRKVLDDSTDKVLHSYAIEYNVVHNESFLTFLSDGCSSIANPKDETEDVDSQSPGAQHVCKDCAKLEVDIITLLKYVQTINNSHTNGKDWSTHPPEISALASKYLHLNGFDHTQEKITTDSEVPVQVICPENDDTGSYPKSIKATFQANTSNSIDIPVLRKSTHEDETDANNIAHPYFLY